MAYQDGSTGVTDKGYYFPGVLKRVPLSAICSASRANVSAFRGRGRIWGTANPGYWANFDPRRPRKTVAFLIDASKVVRPFVTADDPAAFEAALHKRGIEVTDRGTVPVV